MGGDFCFIEIGNTDRRNRFTEGKSTFKHVEFETNIQLEMANEHSDLSLKFGITF